MFRGPKGHVLKVKRWSFEKEFLKVASTTRVDNKQKLKESNDSPKDSIILGTVMRSGDIYNQ